MMDLGATLCTRSSPLCSQCPVHVDCVALAKDETQAYPGKKPRKKLPVKSTVFLMIRAANGDILLEKRPSSGIWGSLWCFPEVNNVEEATTRCLDNWGIEPSSTNFWEPFRHTFSHYHLDIQPLQMILPVNPETVMEADRQLWYNVDQPPRIGLAAPVATLLKKHTAR
jgi:A/G-specific adenine glycosylase